MDEGMRAAGGTLLSKREERVSKRPRAAAEAPE